MSCVDLIMRRLYDDKSCGFVTPPLASITIDRSFKTLKRNFLVTGFTSTSMETERHLLGAKFGGRHGGMSPHHSFSPSVLHKNHLDPYNMFDNRSAHALGLMHFH